MVAGFLGLGTIASQWQGCERPPLPAIQERFDPRLAAVDSVDAAVAFLQRNGRIADPVAYADAADAFLRDRFVHGYSLYRPCQNWLAWAAAAAWQDLKSPVLPDEILRHRRAACSQQAIVFQALMRRRGLDVRSVGLPGHFLSAVKLRGRWFVYDSNKEIRVRRYPLDLLQRGGVEVERLYPVEGRGFRTAIAAGKLELRPVNADPAPQAGLFQRATGFVSRWGLSVSLLLLAGVQLLLVGGARDIFTTGTRRATHYLQVATRVLYQGS